MAILRSLDGKFYELPDEEVGKYEMSEEKVKEMGGDMAAAPEMGQDDQMAMGHQDPAGNITINLNLGGGGGGQMMMPPPQQGKQEGDQAQDVQGHHWVVYHNRYWAYRNRYWAYRNRY